MRARCKKRRNSYRLFLYHAFAASVSFILFIIALAFYLSVWGQIRTVGKNCKLGSNITGDSDLRDNTAAAGRAVICSGEDFTPGACELAQLRSILDFMMVNGVSNCIQSVMSLALCMSFRMFTNMPQERLQYDAARCSTRCLGGLCKWGPWVTRFVHVFQCFALFVIWSTICANTCKGDLTKTRYCATYSKSCAYNKLKNCQYYYTYCAPSSDLLMACFTIAGRAGFSGRMDIRLLTQIDCARCQLLSVDADDMVNEDEFSLVDATDRNNSQVWKCSQTAQNCMNVGVLAKLACSCAKEVRLVLDVTNANVTSWWTDLIKLCSRRLDGRSALLDGGSDAVELAGEFALLEKPTAKAEAPAGRVVAGPERGGAGRLASVSEDVRMPADGGGDGAGQTGAAAVSSRSRPWGADAAAAAGLPLHDRRLDDDGQACSWAPKKDAPYYFAADQCSQAGSVVFRFAVMYMYLSGCCCVLVTIVGQAVRVMSVPEPWFFNPNSLSENIVKRLLRMTGP